MIDFELLRAEIPRHPYPLLFATVNGAHLYGFPSPDSDYDLRGAHILPAREAVGLLPKRETIEVSGLRADIEMDLVTHDVLKFFGMLLKRNGYVLEQLYSPLVVHTTREHEELKTIAMGCVTRHHSHHYLGFAATQWDLLQKDDPPRVKPLLYVYRVILTGIHLMRTGRVEANLLRLNEEFKLAYVPELVARKVAGPEKGTLDSAELGFHSAEYRRLLAQLEAEATETKLPDEPLCREALHDLLVRIRLDLPGQLATRSSAEPKLELLKPWQAPYSPSGVEAELRREAGPGHPLYDAEATALAVARDRDDVLFRVGGVGSIRYAVVHLTGSRRTEPHPFPRSQFFDTLDQWIEWMKADHADYMCGES